MKIIVFFIFGESSSTSSILDIQHPLATLEYQQYLPMECSKLTKKPVLSPAFFDYDGLFPSKSTDNVPYVQLFAHSQLSTGPVEMYSNRKMTIDLKTPV